MTALVLHGITTADAPKPEDAAPHMRIPAAALLGIATQVTPGLLGEASEPPLAEARLHHELLLAYACAEGILPVRFGAVFSDAEALVRSLMLNQTNYISQLASLAGCVEYLLKIRVVPRDDGSFRTDPAQLPDDGRGFLKKKRMVRDDRRTISAKRAAFVGAIGARLGAIADMQPINSSADPQVLAARALLVTRSAVPEMLASAERIAEDAVGLGLKMSLRGPLPVYSFVAGSLSEDAVPDLSSRKAEFISA